MTASLLLSQCCCLSQYLVEPQAYKGRYFPVLWFTAPYQNTGPILSVPPHLFLMRESRVQSGWASCQEQREQCVSDMGTSYCWTISAVSWLLPTFPETASAQKVQLLICSISIFFYLLTGLPCPFHLVIYSIFILLILFAS